MSSDDEGFDFNQGLTLKNPPMTLENTKEDPSDNFKPLELTSEQEKEIDDWFGDSAEKWEESVRAKEEEKSPRKENSVFNGKVKGFGLGFGEEQDSDNVENVKLDWDASTIFGGLASEETDREDSICVLRLYDILTKCEMGIQQISRQMINCGRKIAESSPQQRHELGFLEPRNRKSLAQLIKSVHVNSNLMLVELAALGDILDPAFSKEKTWTDVVTSSKVIWTVVTVGAIVGTTYVAYQRYVTTRNILWVAYKVAM